MKVTQEKLPASQVNLAIELPATLTQSTYEQTIQKLSRQVKISGFRPGKIPRKVLIQQIGSQMIKARAIETLLEQSVLKAFEKEKIEAIGSYEVTPDFETLVNQFEPNQPLLFSIVVDVEPTVVLHQYSGFTVQAESVDYNPDKVEEVIDRYRKQLSTLLPVEEDRPAQAGDVAVLDYEGFFVLPQDAPEGTEPQPVPQAQGKDAQVDLEPGNFIPGFVDGIIGMTINENRNVSATFPSEYPVPELAGQPVVFQVILKELKLRELAALDDEFAQSISDYSTLEDLRNGLESRYKGEAEQKEMSNKIHACLKKLAENVEAELPETLIKDESNLLIKKMAANLSQQGVDVNQLLTKETIEMLREDIRPNAILEIKQSLGLRELAQREHLSVPEREIKERMQDILSQLDKSQKVDPKRLRTIATDELMREVCLEWLVENNTIEMVPPGTLPDSEDDIEVDLSDDPDFNESDSVDDAIEVEYSSEESEADLVLEVSASLEISETAEIPEASEPAQASEISQTPGSTQTKNSGNGESLSEDLID